MKNLVLGFFLLGSPLLQAQSSVDSLKSLLILKDGSSGTERIDILNAVADQLRMSDPRAAVAYANEALTAATKYSYKKGAGRAYIIISDYYFILSSYEKSLEAAFSALTVFESLKDKKGLTDSYFILGRNYMELNDTAKRDEYFSRALALAEELHDNLMLAALHNIFGIVAVIGGTESRDFKKGLPHYLKALSFVEKNDKAFIKVQILGNIGSVYDITRHDEAEKAQRYFHEALRLARIQNNKRYEANIRNHLGCLYKDQNQLLLAEQEFRIAEKLSRQTGVRANLLSTYISFIELKMKQGLNQEAHEYQRKYAWARDSIFNAERAQEIAGLEAQYESKKKEETIHELEQEKQMEAVWRNVLIAGVMLTILVSFFIFRLQMSRSRKTRQLLEVQQLLNDKLKEIDGLKTHFFTAISHEFRTPLTLILAPLESELKKRSSGEGKERLLLIRRNANRLLELVNQLLDLSKLESGKMGLHVKQGDISKFLTLITTSFDSLAEHKKIAFVKKHSIGESACWYDPDKLEKMVNNLLANAFKNTPAGGTVTVELNLVNDTLSIGVSDTGPGISPEEQENVFAPFYQTRNAIVNHEIGTGIGLSLVKELVKVYNGNLSLRSHPDTGTSFSVSVPVHKNAFTAGQIFEDAADPVPVPSAGMAFQERYPEKESTANPPEDPADSKPPILVVEDNNDMKEYMSTVLQDNNYTILTASDGEEALHLAIKFIPCLVLTDLLMPKMDGIELTRKIKLDERTSHIPVILLTGKHEQKTKLEGLKTGADDYLTKPFSPEELLIRIANLIEQRRKLQEKFQTKIVPIFTTPVVESSMEERFLNKAREVVESNMSDYTFSVEKMADEMNLSRTQLLRKMKALTGLSPNDFIKTIRLKHAAELIRQRANTVTQIGYTVGFNDQSYFTKCFKKAFGVTPTEFSTQSANSTASPDDVLESAGTMK